MPKSDLDPKSSPKSDPLEFAHLPSGELNVPYLLANANLLFQEGDLAAAASLFRAVKSHPKYGFCGDYGLGQCYLAEGKFQTAAAAFEKAYAKCHRGYIAVAHLEALKCCGYRAQLQNCAIIYAQEFNQEEKTVERIRALYTESLGRPQ
jgi:tetratricopeptide (TPR) repeat protein